MDKGLRITVGNDVYYGRKRSPGDLRDRLRPRMDVDPRVNNEREGFHDRKNELRTGEREHWEHQRPVSDRPARWSPNREQFARGRSPPRFMPFQPETRGRNRFSPDPVRRYERTPPRDSVYGHDPHRITTAHQQGSSPHRLYNRSPQHRVDSHSPHPQRNRSPFGHSSHSRSRHRSSSGSSERTRAMQLQRGSDKVDDDFLLTMYSRQMEYADHEKTAGYLHPALERNLQLKQENKQNFPNRESRAYINPAIINDGHALNALTEAYSNSTPPQKTYSSIENIEDDEERYLYGDTPPISTHRSKKSTSSDDKFYHLPHHENISRHSETSLPQRYDSPERNTRSSEEKGSKVTPGGFDTNALKNVLKAIGFDFELSAQSLQKAGLGKEPKESKVPSASALKKEVMHTESVSQKSYKKSPPRPKPVQSVYSQPPPQQSYQIQTVRGAQLLNPQHLVQSSQMGGGVYIYQPQPISEATSNYTLPTSIPQQVVPVHQAIPQPEYFTQPIVQDRPNLKVISTNVSDENKISSRHNSSRNLVPVQSTKSVEEEKKARKKRLDYLEVELDKLKKQQSELIRKKKRQLNQGEKELMKHNSMLQAGVEKQIQEIREAAERAAGIKTPSGSNGSQSSSSDVDAQDYNYIDTGGHFCKECDTAFNTLADFLSHLHAKAHKKMMDPYHTPWRKKNSGKPRKSKNAITVPLKGAQFIMPVEGYFCEVCKIFTGDQTATDGHVKTRSHNLNYEKHIKKNPPASRREQASDIRNVAEKIKKLKQGNAQKILLDEEYRNEFRKDSREVQRRNLPQDQESSLERLHRSIEQSPLRVIKARSRERSLRTLSRERSSPRTLSPHSRDHTLSHGRTRPRERSPAHRPSSPYRRKISPSHHDVRRVEDKSHKPALKRHFAESPMEHKRDKDMKRESKSKRWSPGYDAYEREREKEDVKRDERRKTEKESAKLSGMGFGKFTWKKNGKNEGQNKRDAREKLGRSTEKSTKINLKMTGKAGVSSLRTSARGAHNRITRNKSGLSGRVGNFAPYTRIKTGMKKEQSSTLSKDNVRRGKISLVSKKGISTKSTPVANTIPTLRSGNQHSRNDSPKQAEPAKQQSPRAPSTLVELKREKREPPPPGEEDMFYDGGGGNASDASGISMEIGSDEGL